jgi:hypothetical protein
VSMDAAGWAERIAEGITVWASYRPSDLLMYSPATWWRLIGRSNAELWPLPLLLPAAGVLAGIALAWWPQRRAAVFAALVFAALAWAIVGWAFHAQRFAAIHWAAGAFAVAFGLQALLWLALAPWLQAVNGRGERSARRVGGFALLALALAGWPLAGVLAGRPWAQAEVVGIAPDPTALAALGLLLLVATRHGRWPWLPWIVPLAWCAWSALMRWVMGDALAWLLAATLVGAPLLALTEVLRKGNIDA